MTRQVFNSRISSDTNSDPQPFASNVVATTIVIEVTDYGGGSGSNTLEIGIEAIPNYSAGSGNWIYVPDTDNFPPVVIAHSELPFRKVITYVPSGTFRLTFDYGGGGTKVFAVKVWLNP